MILISLLTFSAAVYVCVPGINSQTLGQRECECTQMRLIRISLCVKLFWLRKREGLVKMSPVARRLHHHPQYSCRSEKAFLVHVRSRCLSAINGLCGLKALIITETNRILEHSFVWLFACQMVDLGWVGLENLCTAWTVCAANPISPIYAHSSSLSHAVGQVLGNSLADYTYNNWELNAATLLLGVENANK